MLLELLNILCSPHVINALYDCNHIQLQIISILTSMKNQLNDSLICQQIDIAVMGPKSLEIIQSLLDHKLQTSQCEQSNDYLRTLRSLFYNDKEIEPKRPAKKISGDKKMHKFSTNICTNSLWIEFNFYMMDEKAYDPLLAPIIKNGISICIIANDEDSPNSGHLKNLVTVADYQPQGSKHCVQYNETSQKSSPSLLESSKNNSFTKNRHELLFQIKILNRLHEMHINEFKSVLALKLYENGRIVEETNNLRLNRNQILRWIFDRHFENHYQIKIREELSDQIETQYQIEEPKGCQLI